MGYIKYALDEGSGSPTSDVDGLTVGSELTLGGATWASPGHDGTGSMLQTANTNGGSFSADSGYAAWTLMGWFRLDANHGSGTWISFFQGTWLGWVEAQSNGDGTFTMDWYANQGGELAGGTLDVDTWYHVAVQSDGALRNLLIDGTIVATTGSGLSSGNGLINVAADSANYMSLDALGIYDALLTEAEVSDEAGLGGTTITGTLDATLPNLTAALSGTVSGAPVAGALGATLPTLTGALSGSVTVTGVLDASLPQLEASIPDDAEPPFPATTSGRNLLDQNGNPWMMRGDAPWSAAFDLSTSEWDSWCANRAGHGFNAALFSMVGTTDNGGPSDDGATYDGVLPFVGGDVTVPNETYWARMDTFVDTAAAYGITLFAYPIDGWNDYTVFDGVSDADCETYGEFIGTRYGDRLNLVWMVGGDYFQHAGGNEAFWSVMTGIKNTESTTHLFSIQLGYHRSWSTQNSFWADKVDFNFVYSYYPQYEPMRAALAQSPLPAIWMEGGYEGETFDGTTNTAESCRRQVGWALTSGSQGDGFGSDDWEFLSGWEGRLDTTAVTQISAMRDHVRALDGWHLLEPDEDFITSGEGAEWTSSSSGNDHPLDWTTATAAVTPDGSLALVYVPTQRAIQVDTSPLGSSPTGTWYDAQTGATSSAGALAGSVTAPTSGDSFLVIEATPAVITGGIDATLPGLTGSASGTVTVGGELDATLPGLEGQSAGDVVIVGALAGSAPTLTGQVAGDVVVTGSLDAALPQLTASLSADGFVGGELDAALPSVTADLAGTVTIAGALAAAMPGLTADLAGTVVDPENVTGDVDAALPTLAGSVAGTVTIAGTLTATLPMVTASLADVPLVRELTIGRGPYGSTFAVSQPRGHALAVSTPRRQDP